MIDALQSDDFTNEFPRTPGLTNPKRMAEDALYAAVARCDNLEELKTLWERQLLGMAKTHPDFQKLKSYVNDRKSILTTKRKP